MKYEKPELVVLAAAVKAVQGNNKTGGSEDVIPSTPAYEADE